MLTLPRGAAFGLALLASAAHPALAASLSADEIDGATLEAFETRQAEREKKAAEAAPGAAVPGLADTSSPEAAPSDDSPSEASTPEEAIAADAAKQEAADPFLVRLQVLLDRAHASPGVIDGFYGDNVVKAVRAYEEMRGLPVDGRPDAELWKALSTDGGAAMKTYEVTAKDVDGRYVEKLPRDYAELAKLKHLGFRGPREMLAERFHMDEDLLRSLNPTADFDKPGTTILVADTGADPETKVTRIVVDKSKGELLAYAEDGTLVLVDPASIGSEDTPSPSGEVTVEAIAPRPTYTYDPKKNFQQGKNDEAMTIPAGPNGPVGAMWIDLSKPTYGIHGTAEPAQIGKTQSHGCVRLTNWDAETLAGLVEKGKTVVVFQE